MTRDELRELLGKVDAHLAKVEGAMSEARRPAPSAKAREYAAREACARLATARVR